MTLDFQATRPKIQLQSIGDCFPAGAFDNIYSYHDRVVNFSYENIVISAAEAGIFPGPFRIILCRFPHEGIYRIEHSPPAVIINDAICMDYVPAHIYNSSLFSDISYFHHISSGIQVFEQYFMSRFYNQGIVSLLSEKTVIAGDSLFEKELANQFTEAYSDLLSGNILSAVYGFKGRGFGMTPTGDDFLAGLLTGLDVREQSGEKDLSDTRYSIYKHALGENLLSNSFLYQAYYRLYNADWKDLLDALFLRSPQCYSFMERIACCGKSSGIDTLTGFFAAWKVNTYQEIR